MQTICNSGFKVSGADKKAFEYYLALSPKQWTQDALKGMINKAVKTIMRDWFELYKSKQTGSVSTKMDVIIPGILAMTEFKPYNHPTPEKFDKIDKGDSETIQRDEVANIEIWEGGFQVEDYEMAALEAFYADFEGQLAWFMANKVYRRKNTFVKEFEAVLRKDPEITSIPSRHDALINMVVAKPTYRNRVARELESLAAQQGV